ncbi:hypothetical protein PsorP6_013954 [Peronosclerospora sorghi]|uniref:Uncharacterized protein n=1 Tax=Peronosclerospora sorghi TaxID=230839 RepID=A0ACC0VHF0_9STRA|nr:hypothetical protein PsorP6_013954 [Peronosclerospora sorghi]
MQTISEDFATLATPGPYSLQRPDSTTSSSEDGRVVLDHVHSSHGATTVQSAGAMPARTSCVIFRKSLDKYVPVVMSIVIGSYVGVGVRVLLTEFATVLNDRQTELLKLLGVGFYLPNVVGCFIMGLVTRMKPVLRGQYDALLTGVTTGFCGSCTTFASWDLGAALMFVHGRWLNAIFMLCIQVASAIISLRFGFHVAEGIVHYFILREYPFRKPPINLGQLNLDLEKSIDRFREIKMHTFGPLVARRVRATEEWLAVARDSCNELMAEITQVEHEQHPIHHRNMVWVMTALSLTVLFWILAFCGFDTYPSSRILALCFGPFGALLRWYLSLFNNSPMCKQFPLYTFLPNVAASCLNCVMEVIGTTVYYEKSVSGYRDFVLFGQGGVMVGFLGSLSTVSTWVNELDSLSSTHMMWAYRYGLLSVVISQLASVFILGIYYVNNSVTLLE